MGCEKEYVQGLECEVSNHKQAVHYLNCEIKSLELRLDEAKELLHRCYRDLNQLNDQAIADAISKFLNE